MKKLLDRNYECPRLRVTVQFFLWGLFCMVAVGQNVSHRQDAHQSSFEAATIKPIDPNRRNLIGFLATGRRVQVGSARVIDLVALAYGVDPSRVLGGPEWARDRRYDIAGISSQESLSGIDLSVARATPTANERQMIAALLTERFGVKSHKVNRMATVYLLERGRGPLGMTPTQHPQVDPRGGFFIKGDIVDGEAGGTNMNMDFLATQLEPDLGKPVRNHTDIQGGFDFHIPPTEPDNKDILHGFQSGLARIGLVLKAGRDSVSYYVIDSASPPSEN